MANQQTYQEALEFEIRWAREHRDATQLTNQPHRRPGQSVENAKVDKESTTWASTRQITRQLATAEELEDAWR